MLGLVTEAPAHELRPAVADITVGRAEVTVEIELALEAMLARIDASLVGDTDEAPNAARYDGLRALAPGAIEDMLRAQWPSLRGNILLSAGETALIPEIAAVIVPSVGDVELVRDSRVTLVADLPPDGSAVTFGWTANNGPLILRQMGAGDEAYSAILDIGEVSKPLARPVPSRTLILGAVIGGAVALLAVGALLFGRRRRSQGGASS